jgi:hypothetical protein
VARGHAQQKGLADRCAWINGDFLKHSFQEKFNYAIVCGVMDYIADARAMIDKVSSITDQKAFFSFPVAGGPLAWQRKLRYKKRCDLFLYARPQLEDLFQVKEFDTTIEPIARDFFVTAVRR